MTASEFMGERNSGLGNNTPCAKCQTPLQGEVTGWQSTAEGAVCDDCYFDVLGEIVENHPIGRGSSR